MTFERSKYSSKIQHTKVVLSFGNFYFTERFVISEINQGIHFGWTEIQDLITAVVEHYGSDHKIAYISNRLNSYSYEPDSWIRLEKMYDNLIASAIVSYHNLGNMNASLDKLMSKKSIKRCETIDEAIEWVLNLNEFKATDVA